MQEFKKIPTIERPVSKIYKNLYQVLVYAEYTCKLNPWITHHSSGGSSSTDFINNSNYEALLEEASNSAFAKIENCSPETFEITDIYIMKYVEQLQNLDDYVYSDTSYTEYKKLTGKKFENHNDYNYIKKIVNNKIHVTSKNERRVREVTTKYDLAIKRMTLENGNYKHYLKLKKKLGED